MTSNQARKWDRDPLDWYVEPEVATELLLERERIIGTVLDPCCGCGTIVKACIKAGVDAHGSDIVDRMGYVPGWWRGTADFLAGDSPLAYDNIIMNPPFFNAKGAEAFIRSALSRVRGKVAAFVDVRFISGGKRANGLFADHPPSRIWIITPRVSCPPGSYLAAGNKAGNGSSDWCWMVWDENRNARTTELGWLRRGK